MKIAYISSSYLPSAKASTLQVMMMCQAMTRLGHEVTLFTPLDNSSLVTRHSSLFSYYGVEPLFRICPVPRGDWRGGAATFQVRSVLAARLRGDEVCFARGRDYLAPVMALAMGRRAIFEVHGLPASPREAWAVRRVAKSARGRVVVISNALRQRYGELGIANCDVGLTTRQSPLVVAPDGVDLRRFIPPLQRDDARRMCDLPLGRRLVVYAGGLYAGRGLEALIAAMAGLDAQLVIVGGRDESELAGFRAAAQGRSVEVIFTGYRFPSEVPKYLFAADVLAMPYSASVETAGGEDTVAWMSPLKMFEYLAAGRPIIATALPALREVLTHEVNALLAAPGSAESIREQTARLLNEPALAERLSRQARADAENYTWEKRAARILGDCDYSGWWLKPRLRQRSPPSRTQPA